jgi:8-oxo-dGTP pyrophosphatase MutT (NUDIX family)
VTLALPGGLPADTEPLWLPDLSLVQDLRRYLRVDPASSTAGSRFESWAWSTLLDQVGPGLLTRAAAPAHVTASAIVFDPDLTHTLLVLHGRAHLWVQPGGHLEAGDLDLAAAAAREALEETGLQCQVLPIAPLLSRHNAPCRPGEVDWHLDLQFACLTERTPPLVSEESDAVAWCPLDDLPQPLASDMRIDEALALVRAHRAERPNRV